jgi:hypothetical protein
MKKVIYSSLIIVGVFMMSCTADKTEDTITPSSDARDQYVGYWNANENSALAGSNAHVVNVVKSSTSSSEVLINNFSGLSVAARAIINSSTFTIPYQQIGSIGFTQGSGTLNSATQITLSYTTTTGTSRDSSSTIYTKQ